MGIRSAIAAKEDGLTSDDDLLALFTYLLRYKRVPGNLLQQAEFLWWKEINKQNWKYEVSRTDILDIIAAIKKNGEKPEAETPSVPPKDNSVTILNSSKSIH